MSLSSYNKNKINSSSKELDPVLNEELRSDSMQVPRSEDHDNTAASANSRGPSITNYVSHGQSSRTKSLRAAASANSRGHKNYVSHGPDLPAHSTSCIAASPVATANSRGPSIKNYVSHGPDLPAHSTSCIAASPVATANSRGPSIKNYVSHGPDLPAHSTSSIAASHVATANSRGPSIKNYVSYVPDLPAHSTSSIAASPVASANSRGPRVKNYVSHGPDLPTQSTFWELKNHPSQKTRLEPEEQKHEENLNMASVTDNSSVMPLEKPKSKERNVGELNKRNERLSDAREDGVESNEMSTDAREIGVKSNEMSKAFEAIAGVKAEVDILFNSVPALDEVDYRGTKVSDKEFALLTELLIEQLLKLDNIEAEGDARVQRKVEVRRVQGLLDKLDTLKERNSNPSNNNSNDVTSQNNNGVTSQNNNGATSQNSNGAASQNGNAVSVTTTSETFDSGMGSHSAPIPMPSSTEEIQDCEMVDI